MSEAEWFTSKPFRLVKINSNSLFDRRMVKMLPGLRPSIHEIVDFLMHIKNVFVFGVFMVWYDVFGGV